MKVTRKELRVLHIILKLLTPEKYRDLRVLVDFCIIFDVLFFLVLLSLVSLGAFCICYIIFMVFFFVLGCYFHFFIHCVFSLSSINFFCCQFFNSLCFSINYFNFFKSNILQSYALH